MIKKAISSIFLGTLLIGMFGNPVVNASNDYILAKGFMTYPVTDNSLGVLVNEPVDKTGGLTMKFVMKNDSGVGLCAESKSVPVVNGLFSYRVGSQYSINANGNESGCNVNALTPNKDYIIEYSADVNGNGLYNDTIDVSGYLSYEKSSDTDFQDSFLDSRTLNMQDSIISGVNITGDGGGSSGGDVGASATANIEYNISAGALNTQLISSGYKTKIFDLDGDGVSEVFSVKDGIGIIYTINKQVGSYENVYSSSLLTLEDATNIFVSGKYGNFILHGALSVDPSTTLTNITGSSIAMKNGMVSIVPQTIKTFIATDFVEVNLKGKNTSFDFNPLIRQYEEKVSITLGGTSNLYGDVTSGNWVGTPFAGNKADYYAGEVREAEVNGTTVSDIDGVVYGDFNADNKLDFISYKNANGGKAYFSIHMETASGTHMKVLDSVLGDGITAGVSLLNNSADFGTDVNEIIITNGKTKSVYKLNGAWESSEVGLGNDKTMSLIATFDSTFYAILGNEGGTINKNETYLSIGDKFRDMNDSNINDKFLVIGNFKVNKDGYDYYDYYLKKFNGTEFVDLLDESGKAVKFTGNKIGFQKIAVSDFYVFYVDQSTHYTKGKQDKTDLYYIHTNTVLPIMTNVIVNNNNTVVTQDGINNEGGIKLLKNSTFGFFGINLEGIGSGFLGIKNNNYVSSFYNGYIQSESIADNRKYLFAIDGRIQTVNKILVNLDEVIINMNEGIPIININDLPFNKGLLYDSIENINWGVGIPREGIGGRPLINTLTSKEKFIDSSVDLFYKSSTEIGFYENISNVLVPELTTDKTKYTKKKLSNKSYFIQQSNYLYKDNFIGINKDDNNFINGTHKGIFVSGGGLGIADKSNIYLFLDKDGIQGKGENQLIGINLNSVQNIASNSSSHVSYLYKRSRYMPTNYSTASRSTAFASWVYGGDDRWCRDRSQQYLIGNGNSGGSWDYSFCGTYTTVQLINPRSNTQSIGLGSGLTQSVRIRPGHFNAFVNQIRSAGLTYSITRYAGYSGRKSAVSVYDIGSISVNTGHINLTNLRRDDYQSYMDVTFRKPYFIVY